MKEFHLNTTAQPARLIRKAKLIDLYGAGSTQIDDDVREGVMTSPIKPSKRLCFWPEYEVAIINAARIAGRTPAELRELVQQLHAKRKADAAQLLPQG